MRSSFVSGRELKGGNMVNILEDAEKKQRERGGKRKSHLHYDDGYESDCCSRKNKILSAIGKIPFASGFCLARVSRDKSFSSMEGGQNPKYLQTFFRHPQQFFRISKQAKQIKIVTHPSPLSEHIPLGL